MSIEIGVALPYTLPKKEQAEYARVLEEEVGVSFVTVYHHTELQRPDKIVFDSRGKPHKSPLRQKEPISIPEPFSTLTLVAAQTERVSLVTDVLVSPMMPTLLVAGNLAELQNESNGRVIAGLGVGWNPQEYTNMGIDYHTRGRRLDEQVLLLRRLWTEEDVTFRGEFDHLQDATISYLPQKPIPLWFAGKTPPSVRRAALMGDGWIQGESIIPPEETVRLKEDVLDPALRERQASEGTTKVNFSIMFKNKAPVDPSHFDREGQDTLNKRVETWLNAGATHIVLTTNGPEYPFGDRYQKHLESVQWGVTRIQEIAGQK